MAKIYGFGLEMSDKTFPKIDLPKWMTEKEEN